MSDRTEIIELVDAILDTVDAKNWDAAQALFESKVTVDFTSLNGGEPATTSSAELVDGWRQGLHPQKKSFHLVGHYRVTTDGDMGTVAVKGYLQRAGAGTRSQCIARPLAGGRHLLLRLAHPRRRLRTHTPHHVIERRCSSLSTT